MDTPEAKIPPALQQVIEDFKISEGREKLELLIGMVAILAHVKRLALEALNQE